MSQNDPAQQQHDGLATALGWTSVGLGAPLTAATSQTLDAIGVEEDDTTPRDRDAVGAHRPAAVSGPQGPAVPQLSPVREPDRAPFVAARAARRATARLAALTAAHGYLVGVLAASAESRSR